MRCERCRPERPHQGAREDSGGREGNCWNQPQIDADKMLYQKYPTVRVYLMDEGTVLIAMLYIHVPRLKSRSQIPRVPLLSDLHKHQTVYDLEPYLSFQIFQLLPVRKSSYIPYGVEDPDECLHVRPRRYILPHPGRDMNDDAHSVFQVFPALK